jgi:hypothetical protein
VLAGSLRTQAEGDTGEKKELFSRQNKIIYKARLELLIFIFVMSAVTVAALLGNILTVKMQSAALGNDTLSITGWKLFTQYATLSGGGQLVVFFLFAILCLVLTLAFLSFLAFVSKSKTFYRLALSSIVLSAVGCLLVGLFGKYYQIVQELNKGMILSWLYDLSGGMRAIFEEDAFYIIPRSADAPCPRASYDFPLEMGCNPIGEEGEGALWLFPERSVAFENANKNIYNLFIQADLSSATMGGKLSARSRRAGDAYRTGGMTRVVRRLFSSAHLSRALRSLLPIVYDDRGILWVPGFGVRDSEKKSTKGGPYAYFCYGRKD